MKKKIILLLLFCGAATVLLAQSREFTGMDGQRIIVNEEAGTVEMIYRMVPERPGNLMA
jgi:hypothetical protein